MGRFTVPHGIRVDPEGNVGTLDAATSIVTKFSPEGAALMEIPVGGQPVTCNQDPKVDGFCGTTDVAFGPDGGIFVSDGYENARVIAYKADGRRMRHWGRRGSHPGAFDVPHSIAVAPNGFVYVADRENGRLQWFSPNGRLIGQRRYGGQLYSLTFTPSGALYIGTRVPGGIPGAPPEGYIIKLNPSTGEPLGQLPMMAHELAATGDGALLRATTGRTVVLRVRE